MAKNNEKVVDGTMISITLKKALGYNSGLSMLLDEVALGSDTQWKITDLKSELEALQETYQKAKKNVDKLYGVTYVQTPFGVQPQFSENSTDDVREKWEEETEKLQARHVEISNIRFDEEEFEGVNDPANKDKKIKPPINARFRILLKDIINRK